MRSPISPFLHDYRQEFPVEPDPAERRTRMRFFLELRVRFRTLRQAYPVAGMGWATNISSSGVWVAYQHDIAKGTPIELNIEWPTRLEGRIPLQLVAMGRVVRCERLGFAVGLERYHFRIAGRTDFRNDKIRGVA